MDKFALSEFTCYNDLPIDKFEKAGYSIYVIDKDWNYLYVNKFVIRSLGPRAEGMIGKNMWEFFPELVNDSAFALLKANTEKGVESNFETISPITANRLHITGHALSDCYIFTSSILPKREEIFSELRRQLEQRKQ